jgi:multicomponent K+:H+ antiporter subunit G
MAQLVEILVATLLFTAGGFAVVGSFGLIKLPDPMTRLHAPTKASTLGVGGVLLASILAVWLKTGALSVHELLVTLFLVLTAPITANFIAKAHMHYHLTQADLPPTGTARPWATLDLSGDPVEPVMVPAEKPETPN